MEALVLVATVGRAVDVARIGVMRALNYGKPDPAIVPQGKRAKVYKVIRLADNGGYATPRFSADVLPRLFISS